MPLLCAASSLGLLPLFWVERLLSVGRPAPEPILPTVTIQLEYTNDLFPQVPLKCQVLCWILESHDCLNDSDLGDQLLWPGDPSVRVLRNP